jgi:hypothetical protein
MPLVHAANASGVSFHSLNTYRNKHPEFADALSQAISKGIESRLEVIERATNSQDEAIRLRAACWFLEHTAPEHFSKTRIQVEAVGSLEHSFVIPRETLDQIAEARARHEQKQLEGNGAA